MGGAGGERSWRVLSPLTSFKQPLEQTEWIRAQFPTHVFTPLTGKKDLMWHVSTRKRRRNASMSELINHCLLSAFLSWPLTLVSESWNEDRTPGRWIPQLHSHEPEMTRHRWLATFLPRGSQLPHTYWCISNPGEHKCCPTTEYESRKFIWASTTSHLKL